MPLSTITTTISCETPFSLPSPSLPSPPPAPVPTALALSLAISLPSGGKDHHRKVLTMKGLRDRRIWLSISSTTALCRSFCRPPSPANPSSDSSSSSSRRRQVKCRLRSPSPSPYLLLQICRLFRHWVMRQKKVGLSPIEVPPCPILHSKAVINGANDGKLDLLLVSSAICNGRRPLLFSTHRAAIACSTSSSDGPGKGDENRAVKEVDRLLEEKRRAELAARIASGEFTVQQSGITQKCQKAYQPSHADTTYD